MTRDSTLGRPASMPSLYPSNDNRLANNEMTMETSNRHPRSSLDNPLITATTKESNAQNQQVNSNHHHVTTTNNYFGWNQNTYNSHFSSSSTTTSASSYSLTSMNNSTTTTSTNTDEGYAQATHRNSSIMNDLPSIDRQYLASTAVAATATAAATSATTTASSAAPLSAATTSAATNAYITNQVFSNNNYLLANTNRSPYSPQQSASSNGSHQSSYYPTTTTSTSSSYGMSPSPMGRHGLVGRPKLTTTLWEDEGTICYQVDANGICVARRQDNDMINGTKLLNVAGMSRGKRDGILKNEKGRVVIKIGAMHLKGVWITFDRAKVLSAQYKIQDILYPLFVDDPTSFLYNSSALHSSNSSRANYGGLYNRPYYNLSSPLWDRSPSSHDLTTNSQTGYRNNNTGYSNNSDDSLFMLSSQIDYNNRSNNVMSGYQHSPYYTSPQQQQDSSQSRAQQPSRMYYTDELLDDSKSHSITNTTSDSTSFYGQKLPGTTATSITSPTTPSEAGKSSHSREYIGRNVTSSSARHHPYINTYYNHRNYHRPTNQPHELIVNDRITTSNDNITEDENNASDPVVVTDNKHPW
ncbi:MAG: hypothetical protein EXX96DRAFT_571372 [Benjaminiella poitrasii]|nr:MAG: hypothetical protein EXX96DRAFT_571372 [Benjaminiella poitrasii]